MADHVAGAAASMLREMDGGGPSLLDGALDEAAERASFREAVESWRAAGARRRRRRRRRRRAAAPRVEAMAAQRSREGYFGDASASTPSNKGGAPRIVLGDAYGRPRLNGQDWSLDEASGRAKFVKADVSVAAELEAAVDATVAAFGRVDCVVNNAGWHPPHKPIDDFSVDDVQDLLQLNFVSAFALCKFALPHLRASKGCIVNMSSLVGHFGQAKACTYAATKGALTAFTKALAIDEAPNGVRVNSVMGRMGTILEAGRLCLCIAADMTFTTGVDHIFSGGAEIGYGMRA
ncbi:hypothetical protein JL722_550 [Aureococcus anophagefferens]|nr:hypothetical protein JL722_550 [Aureococcus anophagefferens]